MMQGKKRPNQLVKIVWMMRLIYLIQILIVVSVIGYLAIQFFINKQEPTATNYIVVLAMALLMLLVNGYFIINDSQLFRGFDRRLKLQKEAYDNIELLNRNLRVQRHDFLNHIQILYSLMELEEYHETRDYLNKLYGDVGKLSANIKTHSVAINALLQAKSNEAEAKGINYEVKINTRIESLNMPDWELCKVLGNLIDNAFEAAKDVADKAFVEIIMNENILEYEVFIRNSSMMVPEAIVEKLFLPGFTTKIEKENHGMGLYIIKELLEKYNNKIMLNYQSNIMTATIHIHKSV